MEALKIGLVGYGYWGKIIRKTLKKLGHEVLIYDKLNIGMNKFEDVCSCNNVFVVVPTDNHFEICQKCLSNGSNVFCEKPLTTTVEDSKTLFGITEYKKNYLFVDWLFTFNDHVEYIKNIIENNKLGQLKSVNMNRLNIGPVREDVPARFDLASHDISILTYMLDEPIEDIKWIDYKRNKKSKQYDSCVGMIQYPEAFAQINCSWHYGQKDRTCIFEFDCGFLIWDDITQTIKINNKDIHIDYNPPLINSINAFLNQTVSQSYIKNQTLAIEELLNACSIDG